MPRPLVYNGKGTLKAAGVILNYTKQQVEETQKCASDPVYFIENYCKITTLDHGTIFFKMHPYQKRIIETVHNNKNTVAKLFRQAGKSTIIAAYFAWYVTFNKSRTVVISANKLATAKEIFERVQYMIENLPIWLQQGVVAWNLQSFRLENGSRCIASSSSPSAIRGWSPHVVLCDEFAHLQPKLAQAFISSVFPTVSSGESGKLIVISTPNGYNHFHKLWHDSEQGVNTFARVEGRWQESRTEKWAEEMKVNLGSEVRYRQEIECSFEGSSFTLIDGVKLAQIAVIPPLFDKEGLKIYIAPEPGRRYVATVDVSRGRHIDNSAMTITDVTEMPYKVCLTYRSPTISTLEFPYLIYNTARQYNDAFILVEVNDLGEEVANTIWYEYEYENMFFSEGDTLKDYKGYPGVHTSTRVKALGCSVLKDLIEKDQYFVNSYDIVQELSIFVKKKKTYAADDESINDDLVATLWLFGWLSKQQVFQEFTNNNLREALVKRKEEFIDAQMTPYVISTRNTPDPQDVEDPYSPTEFDPYYLSPDQISLIG